MVDWISYSYAALVAAGGIMGYAKAGSTASLGMGLAFGAVLAFGAYKTSHNPNEYYLLLGTSAVLCGIMGNRFFHSGKFMPAGLVSAISLAMVLRLVARSLNAKVP